MIENRLEKRIGYTYEETKIEANDDSVGDGNGGELNFTEVTGEGLSDDVHGEGGDAAEDGGAHDEP